MTSERTQTSTGPGSVPGPAGGPATGYTVVLPPGWEQIPVRAGTRDAIRKIADRTFAHAADGVPRDKVTPYRIELERRLSDAASQARSRGGVLLYLPVTLRHGAPLGASFVVSEGSLGSLDGIEPAMVISALAAADAGDGRRAVTVDGAVSLRLEHTSPPQPGKGIDYGSRRVDYVIPVPASQDRWLVIAFSTLGGGDPDDQYARIMVELFDAIMSTFRWTQPQGAAPDGEPGE